MFDSFEFHAINAQETGITFHMDFEPKMGVIGKMITPMMKMKFKQVMGNVFFEDIVDRPSKESDQENIKELLRLIQQFHPVSLKKVIKWIETYEPQNNNSKTNVK